MAMSPLIREHYQAAHKIAQDFKLDAAYFEHEGDPRILLTAQTDKLVKALINPDLAIAWIAAFFPLSTILTFEPQRVIISLGQPNPTRKDECQTDNQPGDTAS